MQSRRRKFVILVVLLLPLLVVLAILNSGALFKKTGYTLDVMHTNKVEYKIEANQQRFRSKDIVDIKQGDDTVVVLTGQGRVYAQGTNGYGEQATGRFGGGRDLLHAIDFGNGVNIVQVDTNAKHIVALSSDGDVWTWGRNLSGQLGDGTRTDSSKPVKVFSGATDIAAGYRFSAAINNKGELWAWGMNCDPNLPGLAELTRTFANDISVGGSYYDGEGPQDSVDCLNQQNLPIDSLKPVQVPTTTPFVSVSAGYGHLLMIDGTAKAWGFGCNGWGQLGRGHTQNTGKTRVVSPVAFPENVRITRLEAGFRHSIALDTDGNVWSWGHSEKGEVMTYKSNKSDKPTKVELSGPAQSVIAGRDISGVIAGNTLYASGNNEVGQILASKADQGVRTITSLEKIADDVDAASLGYTNLVYWKK